MAKLAMILVLVALTNCSERTEQWTGTIRTTEATRLVVNPTNGIAREGELTLDSIWSYSGPAEGPIWEIPESIRVGSDAVYVVDPTASRIHVLGLDGRPLTSFGGPGSGPGEYRRLTDVIPTESGVLVVDGGNARIDVLDESYESVTSYPTGRLIFRVLPWGTDGLLAYGMLGSDAAWQRYDGMGPGAEVEIPELANLPSGEDSTCTQVSSHGAAPVLVRCAFPDLYIYSAGGTLKQHFTVPFEAQLVTDAELEGLIRTMRETMAESGLPSALMEQQVARARDRSRVKPLIRKVSIDDAGGLIAIWQQNPSDYGGGPASIHFLSRSGVYLDSVTFDTAWQDFELVDGVVYSLAKDPDTDQVSLNARAVDMARTLVERVRNLG